MNNQSEQPRQRPPNGRVWLFAGLWLLLFAALEFVFVLITGTGVSVGRSHTPVSGPVSIAVAIVCFALAAFAFAKYFRKINRR